MQAGVGKGVVQIRTKGHYMNRTHGGFPESEALHWNDDTQQQLGRIVFLVMSGGTFSAKQGYIKFYQLKRHFMTPEFDELIERLDQHRREKGFVPLTEMIGRIGEQMKTWGDVVDIDAQPDGPVEAPAVVPVVRREPVVVQYRTPPVAVEQMSLFG